CIAGGMRRSKPLRTSRHTSLDGAATSVSARPLACSRTWKCGSAEVTLLSLAAVAERAQSLQRTAPSWRAKVPCSDQDRLVARLRAETMGGTGSQPLSRSTTGLMRCNKRPDGLLIGSLRLRG